MEYMTATVIVLILVSYFLGAVPTGYLIAKKVMGISPKPLSLQK